MAVLRKTGINYGCQQLIEIILKKTKRNLNFVPAFTQDHTWKEELRSHTHIQLKAIALAYNFQPRYLFWVTHATNFRRPGTLQHRIDFRRA